jgi:bifunctional DNA-binding transcriptional regulator/antitoxin component of YhaV-PrlF toxin-antitoxin module
MEFIVTVCDRGRITIPKEIISLYDIRETDFLILDLKQVKKK